MVPTGPKPRVQRLPGPGSYHGVGLVSTPPVSAQGGVGLVVPNSGLVIPNTMGLVVPSSVGSVQITAPRTVTLPYSGQQGTVHYMYSCKLYTTRYSTLYVLL